MKDTVLEILSDALVFFLIGLEVSSAFRLPLLFLCFRCFSFLVNTGKLSRDLHHGISVEVFAFYLSLLSAMFDFVHPSLPFMF